MNLSDKITFKEFDSKGLFLLKQIFQNEEVMALAEDDCYSDEQLEMYHKKILENQSVNPRRTFEYAVYLENEFIGFADFTIYKQNDRGGIAEVGYFLLPRFWGKGLATAIVQKQLELCFRTHRLHRVIAKCNSENTGSHKVLTKNGFRLEGVFCKQRYKHGRWADEHFYALLKTDAISP